MNVDQVLVAFSHTPGDIRLATMLINALGEKKNPEACISIYSQCLQHRNPDTTLMRALIYACQSKHRLAKTVTKQVLEDLGKYDLVPDNHLLCVILRTESEFQSMPYVQLLIPMLITSGLPRQIFETYIRTPAPGLIIDHRLCAGLLRCFHDGRDGDYVRSIFFWMRDYPETELLDAHGFSALFHYCARTKNRSLGRVAYEHLKNTNVLETSTPKGLVVLFTNLMNMLGRIGGNLDEALSVYEDMLRLDVPPTYVTFISLFDLCAESNDKEFGQKIFTAFLNSPLRDSNHTNLNTAMLKMYGKIYGLEKTLDLFFDMKDSGKSFDVATWTQLIVLCRDERRADQAMILFDQMLVEGVELDEYAFIKLLEICSQSRSHEYGARIYNHLQTTVHGALNQMHLRNAVIEMFGYCESIDAALDIFKELKRAGKKLDAGSWNILFKICEEDNNFVKAQELWHEMLKTEKPILRNYLTLLTLCSRLGALELGKEIHQHISRNMRYKYTDIANALISMYAKCDSADVAYATLQELRGKVVLNIESWNLILESCVDVRNRTLARKLFREIQVNGLSPNIRSWNLLLASHAGESITELLNIFNNILKKGIEPDKETYLTLLANALDSPRAKEVLMAVYNPLSSQPKLTRDPDVSSLLHKLAEKSGIKIKTAQE